MCGSHLILELADPGVHGHGVDLELLELGLDLGRHGVHLCSQAGELLWQGIANRRELILVVRKSTDPGLDELNPLVEVVHKVERLFISSGSFLYPGLRWLWQQWFASRARCRVSLQATMLEYGARDFIDDVDHLCGVCYPKCDS